MEVAKINSTLSARSFKGTETKPVKTPEEVKEGKKKLALALSALALTAGAGIAIAAKKGKLPSLESIKGAFTSKTEGAAAGKTEEAVVNTTKSSVKKASDEVVKYRVKSKAAGKNITKFFENGKLSKTVTSKALPEEGLVEIVTEHANGAKDCTYRTMKKFGESSYTRSYPTAAELPSKIDVDFKLSDMKKADMDENGACAKLFERMGDELENGLNKLTDNVKIGNQKLPFEFSWRSGTDDIAELITLFD